MCILLFLLFIVGLCLLCCISYLILVEHVYCAVSFIFLLVEYVSYATAYPTNDWSAEGV